MGRSTSSPVSAAARFLLVVLACALPPLQTARAAEPTSPLSPFSTESAPAREASIALFATLLDGSDAKVAPALRRELPELLWLLQMGMVLFWVYDQSPDQERTRTMARRVVPIVDRLVRLSRLPVVRGIVDDVVGLMGELRS